MKKYLILVLIVLLISALSVGVLAGKTGQAGKSNIAHLYLHEKVPADLWPIVEDGAWGKMKYNILGDEFDFVFNGHDLKGEAYTEYTLIIYTPDEWPAVGLICLGSGTSDEFYNVHIMGSVDTGDLEGVKIWLVLSSDVDCGNGDSQMTGWNPTEYLFEYDVIDFEDTDD